MWLFIISVVHLLVHTQQAPTGTDTKYEDIGILQEKPSTDTTPLPSPEIRDEE